MNFKIYFGFLEATVLNLIGRRRELSQEEIHLCIVDIYIGCLNLHYSSNQPKESRYPT